MIQIRKALFVMAVCAAVFSGNAMAADSSANCPALAANVQKIVDHTCQAKTLTPVQKGICTYKPRKWTDNLMLLDSTLTVAYQRALRTAGSGTSQCQELLEKHRSYEKQLQQCGSDGDCILKVMDGWTGTMHAVLGRLDHPLDEASLKQFAGGLRIEDEQEAVPLLQRLEQGMDLYPLPQMALPNGNVLVWGFQPHNAQVQSLVIVNRQRQVQLMGLVDGIYYSLPSGKTQWAPEEGARIALFVKDPRQLAQNLAAIRAWSQASILGFNQTCPGKDQARCDLAAKLSLPIEAYDLNCKAAQKGHVLNQHCAIPLPRVAEQLSPGMFWQ